MDKKEQLETFFQVMRQFQSAGILREIMLIGSWCLYFYRHEFANPKSIPAVRTLDADFLIPHQSRIETEADVPALLKSLGFLPTFNRSSRMVVYDHPNLRVEFLVPELGRGLHAPRDIQKFHVKAQSLRYLNLLAEYPRLFYWNDLQVNAPEPSVFAVHKLMISGRRLKKDKRERDVEAATGVLDYLFEQEHEVRKLRGLLKTFPKRWLKNLSLIAETVYPRLTEEIRVLSRPGDP